MPSSPVRFPTGISTFHPRAMLGNYPVAPNPGQFVIFDNFLPYRAGDYTIGVVGTGTATAFPRQDGAIKLLTSAAAPDSVFMIRNGAGFQFAPGKKLWLSIRASIPRTVQSNSSRVDYFGLFNGATPAASTDAIYFQKVTGSANVYLVIKKGGVTTTFQNIALINVPSGLQTSVDPNSVNGTLNAVIAGGIFTGISVATPGAGYAMPPLVLTTSVAGGVLGSVPAIVNLGSNSFSNSNPSVPIQTTGLPYGSLYDPYIIAPGSGFTNTAGSATALEAEAWYDFQFYFDGQTLFAGINGRCTVSIGPDGRLGVAAGGTINVISPTLGGNSFASTTQLSAAVSPVQPRVGSAYNILPQSPLSIGFGVDNANATVHALYVSRLNAAAEFY